MASYFAKETARRARDNVNAFMEFVFGIRQSAAHRKIQKHLLDHRRAGVLAHKDLGKTTQTVGHVTWRLGRDPNMIIKLVCSDDEPATDRASWIRDLIDRNKRLRLVFPHLRKSKTNATWSKGKLVVERDRFLKDASVEACGVLTQGEGSRANLILFDDICDMNNTIRYPGKRTLVKQFVKTVWIPLLDPDNGRAAWLATLHHGDDATCEMMENPKWKWINLSVTGDPPISPWPERWTTEKLQDRCDEIGSIEFDRAYRNLLHSDSERIIKKAWASNTFSTCDRGDLRYASWDLSAAAKKGDYVALAIADIYLQEKMVRVQYITRWQGLTYNGIINEVLRVQEDWKPDKQIFENTGFQVIVARGEELAGIPTIKKNPEGSKEYRLRQTAVWYEQNRVLFKEGTTEGGREELLQFPKGAHDDRVDALTQLILCAIDKLGKAFRPEQARFGGETRTFGGPESSRTRKNRRNRSSMSRKIGRTRANFGKANW